MKHSFANRRSGSSNTLATAALIVLSATLFLNGAGSFFTADGAARAQFNPFFSFGGDNDFADNLSSELNVSAKIEPEQVFEGETPVLSVTVSNAKGDPEINLDALSVDFDCSPAGVPRRQSRTSVVNGRRSESTSITYSFRLAPKKTGAIAVPSFPVKVDGKTLSTQELSIKVLPQSQTDIVLLELSSSKNEVYPLVPFTVSVAVFLKECPGKYADYNPLDLIVQNCGAPRLVIPWTESEAFDEKVITTESASEWLQKYSQRSSGFELIDSARSFFSSFSLTSDPFDFGSPFSRQMLFQPKPERVVRKDAEGNDVRYWKYSFQRTFRAENPGVVNVSPVLIRGSFLNFENDEDVEVEKLYVSADPLRISVKNIPESEAPDDYIGVYGKIAMDSVFSSENPAVGEAASLSLVLSGYGNFDGVKAPDLANIPGVAGNFKVYPPLERSRPDGTEFEYKIRPLKPGSLSFPAVKASYFDVEEGKFSELTSKEKVFDVREGTFSDDEEEAEDEEDSNSEPGAVDAGDELFKISSKFVARCAAGLGGVLALVALVWGGRVLIRKRREYVAASNGRIADRSRKTLQEGLKEFRNSPSSAFASIRLAFVLLAGRKFRQRPDSVTDAEFSDFLDREIAAGGDDSARDTVRKIKEFLAKSEQFRFAGQTDLSEDFERDVSRLLEDWIKTLLRKNGRLTAFAEKAPRQ